jgi:hypothetical protein
MSLPDKTDKNEILGLWLVSTSFLLGVGANKTAYYYLRDIQAKVMQKAMQTQILTRRNKAKTTTRTPHLTNPFPKYEQSKRFPFRTNTS